MTVTTQLILDSLPPAPETFRYEVVQESQMWWSVWLIHPEGKFNYTDETVSTIYAWVKKNGNVHRPLSSKKPHQREVVCTLLELKGQNPYTTIVPTGPKSLLHL